LPSGEAMFRSIEIDLDAKTPRAKYQDDQKTFGFTVQPGETETFNIVAKTARGHYRWVIELDLVVAGDQRTIEISGPGGPFETTAMQSTTSWQWDYEGSWSASPGTPRAGVPDKVTVGTPLPTLD